MVHLCNLLFELSNEDRLDILHHLTETGMNITNISKTLGLTTQESSRHVSRLGKIGLTVKAVDGVYHLTQYGKAVLKQLPGLAFLTQHRNYFSSHSIAHLPQEFLERIGDLSDSTFTDDTMVFLYWVETGMRKAEKHLWAIVDQFLYSSIPLAQKALERKVKMKTIEPEEWNAPPEFYRLREEAEKTWLHLAKKAELIENRTAKKIGIFLYFTEKEVTFAFPTLDGTYDHLGFTSTKEQTRKWCKDLFDYYWENAKPLINSFRAR